MRKLSIPPVFLVGYFVVSVAGCSFEVGTKKDPAVPVTPAPGAAPAANPASPAPAAPPVRNLGRTNRTPSPVSPAPGTPATPPPAGIPVMVGTNVFGTGTPDVTGWKGSFYNINAGATKLPTLAGVTPNGFLFAKELNVTPKAMSGGFPGIDASRNDNFAIRWEAPLVVDNESDYTFRLVSDDGAIITIDGTPIVDNDGAHGTTEKSGPVHLVKGTHAIAVDYFQSTAGVALQVFCKKAGANEVICPTHL